jgi:hypothetical protein
MAITRAKQSSLTTGVTKYDNFRGGLPYTPTIGTATDGGTGTTVSVAFTGNNTAGLTYTALSTPGSLSATGTTSPITVTGLTSGTAYTFAVKATNSAGDSPFSAASNSVTPATPSSYESIASATPTGTGTVTFSSIPAGYTSLQIRGVVISADTDSYCVRLNADTGANYARHRLLGTGTGVAASGTTSTNQIQISNGTDTFPSPFIMDIHNYLSTTQYKTIRTLQGIDQNTAGNVALYSGLWMNTSAVTSVTVFLNSGNYSTGTQIALYGIKG